MEIDDRSLMVYLNINDFSYEDIVQLARMGNIRLLIGPNSPTGEYRIRNAKTLALFLRNAFNSVQQNKVNFQCYSAVS